MSKLAHFTTYGPVSRYKHQRLVLTLQSRHQITAFWCFGGSRLFGSSFQVSELLAYCYITVNVSLVNLVVCINSARVSF